MGSRAAEALEGLEGTVAVGGRDAGATVGGPQLDLVVMAAGGQQYLLAWRAVADRVAHQVGEDALEQRRVGEQPGKTRWQWAASTGLIAAYCPPGGKISYTYDLGACWDHEITLEKLMPRDPGQDYPVCVGYKGDSPVEYWSGDDPEEREPFNLAEVNRRLAALGEAGE